MFVNVSIQSQRSNPPILVPGDALIVDATGAHIGLLRDVRQVQPEEKNGQKKQTETVEGTIHLQLISIGRDYGAATEVLSGLSRGDMVIVNPNDDVREGTKVQATLTKANLDVGNGSPQQSKMNANSEKMQPQPGAEPQTKQPSKTDKKRGPGY